MADEKQEFEKAELPVKMHVLGLKNRMEEIYEERKYLANARNVFVGKSLDRCHVSFDLYSEDDVEQAIEALKALKPCYK